MKLFQRKEKKCESCRILEEENKYLRRLVDKFLKRLNMGSITEEAQTIIEETEEDKRRKEIKENGGVVYGD